MRRVKISEDFYLDEVIPPEIYSARGERSIALMDDRILKGLQLLRTYARVPFVINNWQTGGKFHESGLRLHNTRTGAKWSQHKFGRALDIKPKGMTIRQLFAILKAHEDEFVSQGLITTVENIDYTLTWLHIDCRNTGLNELLIVNP